MQSAKRVAANTGILYAKMGITVFISLYATRLILAALGTEDFGIFNLVGGAIAMLGFLNASMAAASQRFMSFAQGAGDFNKLKQIFNVSVVLHILIAVLLIVILEVAGYYFFNGVLNIPSERLPAAKMIYHFMVVGTVFNILAVPFDAVLYSHENMLIFAILGITESVIKLAIAFYLTSSNQDNLITYGFLIAVLALFLLIIRYFYCKGKYSECQVKIFRYFRKPVFKEMTGFAGWSFLGTSTSMIANFGQAIVLNIFFGPVVNAAQGIANQISGQVGAFATTMLNALNPVIAKSEGAGKRELMVKASMFGSKISFFLLMLFVTPALVEMSFFLNFWLKNVPPYAVVFCQLLLIRNLIEQLFFTLSASIAAVGNIKKYQIYSSILTCFPLVICYILFFYNFPPYTLYIVFICYSITASANMLYFSKLNFGLPIKLFIKNVITRCVISFLISVAITYITTLFFPEGFQRLILVVGVSLITYIFIVWLIGFNKTERRGIMNLVQDTLYQQIPKTYKAINSIAIRISQIYTH